MVHLAYVLSSTARLLADLRQEPNVRHGSMEYVTLPNAKKRRFQKDELPFVKRYGYKPENGFRAVYIVGRRIAEPCRPTKSSNQ